MRINSSSLLVKQQEESRETLLSQERPSLYGWISKFFKFFHFPMSQPRTIDSARIKPTYKQNQDLQLNRLLLETEHGRFDQMKIHFQSCDEPTKREFLLRTIYCRNLEAIKILLKEDIDLNTQDSNGNSLLTYAIVSGGSAIALTLLKSKEINVDLPNKYGQTPLMFATFYGNTKVVKILLSRGANPNAVDEDGNSSMMILAKYGYSGLMEMVDIVGKLNQKGTINFQQEFIEIKKQLHSQLIPSILSICYRNRSSGYFFSQAGLLSNLLESEPKFHFWRRRPSTGQLTLQSTVILGLDYLSLVKEVKESNLYTKNNLNQPAYNIKKQSYFGEPQEMVDLRLITLNYQNYLEIAQALISYQANIQLFNHEGDSAIILAMRYFNQAALNKTNYLAFRPDYLHNFTQKFLNILAESGASIDNRALDELQFEKIKY